MMSTRDCVVGSFVGGIVLFFLGYALYGVLLAGFFEANAGSAQGVTREPFDFVSLAFGQLLWGGALTAILGWKAAGSAIEGARTGAVAGLLFFGGFDLTLYATTNMSTFAGALADAVVASILFSITGAVIVVVARPGK